MSDTILGINFLQILLHIFNLVILVGGLYFLLYNPVKKFMDKRAEQYKAQEDEANFKLQQAEEKQMDYEAKLADVEKEINEMRAKAAKETQEQISTQIDNAKEEAVSIIDNAKRQAEEEKAKIVENAQKEISELAITATEKLLKQSQNETVDQFISAVEGGSD